MKSQRIPLVGSLTNRLESGVIVDSKDQKFVNCFPIVTKNVITGSGKVEAVKRFGYSSSQVLSTSSYTQSAGYCVWSGSPTQYAVFGLRNQSIPGTVQVWDESGAQVGANFTGYRVHSLTETLISGVSTLVALVAKNNAGTLIDAYWYQAGGAWTLVNDADFPTNLGVPLLIVGEPVHKDGFMFVMDVNGRIYNSDLNSVSSWTATGYIDANAEPDLGTGLAKSGEFIAAFNKRTIQFFQNTGNATGSPLTRIPKTINIGVDFTSTTGLRPIIQIGDSVYFVGYNKEDSARHIYKMNGTDPVKISTPAIDTWLNDADADVAQTGHICGSLTQYGMTHVIFTVGTGNTKTYVYCVETGVWWWMEWAFNGTSPCVGNLILSVRTIYSMATSYADAGSALTMTIQTDPLDQGTNRKKFFHAAELVADHRSTSGNTSISWFDDDYATESTARTIDLSTGSRRITRLGSTQRNYNNKRAWKITETVDAPFRGEALELWYEEGTT